MARNKLIKNLKSGKRVIKKSTYRMVPAFEISRTEEPTEKESGLLTGGLRGRGRGGGLGGGNNCQTIGTYF